MSAQLKAFFDRSFCYFAGSYPGSKEVQSGMAGKRFGLVLASEETYPGAAFGITQQIQELTRYTNSALVGVVRGVGNTRGEVRYDPADLVRVAELLDAQLFTRPYSDYRMDAARSMRVWPEAEGAEASVG